MALRDRQRPGQIGLERGDGFHRHVIARGQDGGKFTTKRGHSILVPAQSAILVAAIVEMGNADRNLTHSQHGILAGPPPGDDALRLGRNGGYAEGVG